MKLNRFAFVAAAFSGLAALATAAATAPTLVPPSLFKLSDPSLEITVWATSPMLKNPTNIDTDQFGRIWVAEGVNYRRHYDRLPEGDRILVLQDTDGDGQADKSWTFVQEPFLRSPMGIAVIDNKVIVSMAPDLIVYTDVNRDAKFDPAVDKREVILTGFNGRVHDHTIHSVTVGPDGQWYWNAGNCGALFTDKSGKTFRIGSSYDPYYGRKPAGDLGWDPREIGGQKSDDGHVWVGGFAARMNPDGSQVRIIGHNFRNSYEQVVTSFGDVFQNDNDDPPACRTAFLLEGGNAGFSSADGKRSWQADRRPGQSVPTAQWRQEDPGTMPAGDVYGGGSPTGIAFVEDSALGKQFRGLLLSCEPGRNVVFGYYPKPDGAGFKLERFDFLTSNRDGKFAGGDYNGGNDGVTRELPTLFRPSDVLVGADGAIYVADFFDPRVGGHNDMDDSLSGTIYRIAPKRFKPKVPKVDLTTLDGAVAALKSPAVNVRGAARAAVMAQTKQNSYPGAFINPVAKLLKDENPFVQARAVWLLSRFGPNGLKHVEQLLKSKDAQLRLVAFRALRRNAESSSRREEALTSLLKQVATDASPAVRREAALAIRDLDYETMKFAWLALAKGFDGKDRTYLEALGTAAKGKEADAYQLVYYGLHNDHPERSIWSRIAKPTVKYALVTPKPLKWTDQFAWLAWRLHPPQAIPDFKTRALAASLTDAQRKQALTAIAFNDTKDAADAMLDIAAKSDKGVKAEAIWWLLNRKDSAWKEHGLAAALKERGIYDTDKIELTSIVVPEPPKVSQPLSIPDIAKLKGDPTRGAQIATACYTCHRIGDEGVEFAPNLTGWASRQPLEVLLLSIIKPSADIAHGYGGTELVLNDGTIIHGLLLADADPAIIMSTGGITQTVPKDRIKTKKGMPHSMMLSAEQMGLGPQELADIAAFLRTR